MNTSSMLLMSTLLFQGSSDHRDLHSFPTRRSSDLGAGPGRPAPQHAPVRGRVSLPTARGCDAAEDDPGHGDGPAAGGQPRSEEHTSELQSLAYLVCRLLLEKKKLHIVDR